MKATKVDGVYASDPQRDHSAVKYERISFSQVLQKNLKVMDATAISLARDHDMPIVVFNLRTQGNIRRAILGKSVGTLVEGFESELK
jgi:uridylate kinase